MTMLSELLRLKAANEPSGGWKPVSSLLPQPGITPFLPPARGIVQPVVGLATEPKTAQALAQCGGGWISKDGRVLTKGSGRLDDALRSYPETTAIVAAHEKAERDYRDLYKKTLTENQALHGDDGETVFNAYNPAPELDRSLASAGWIAVELCREYGAKVMGIDDTLDEADDYRETLVALGDGLGCLVLANKVSQRFDLLYDPSDPDGSVNGVREELDLDVNRFRAKWLSTDEFGHDPVGGYYYVLDEKRRVVQVEPPSDGDEPDPNIKLKPYDHRYENFDDGYDNEASARI